ncbi:hypothetical protein BGZ46_001546 [Entomortierella lignicola]|nr:hypothetical protein BGZ46_001546 [Entomortierella lignicola]
MVNGSNAVLNQLFALDLTQPWTTSSPLWKNLTPADSPADYHHTITHTGDKKSLFMWGSNSGVSTYSISSQTWTSNTVSRQDMSYNSGLLAVTDPTSGIIYTPSGASNGSSVMTYDPATGQVGNTSMPTAIITSSLGDVDYDAVWSPRNNNLLMYGGRNLNTQAPTTAPYVVLYGLSNTTPYSWETVTTTGITLGIMDGLCMVTDYYSANTYILEVDSKKWTTGTSAGHAQVRAWMACGVAGDYMVIWGGMNNFSTTGNATFIYNIKEDQWTTTFLPPTATGTTGTIGTTGTSGTPGTSGSSGSSGSSGTTDPTQTSNKSSLGAPIGAGVGVVALVTAIGIFIYFRKKAARRQHQNGMKELPPTVWESKDIDKDPISPPLNPPVLEKSKTSAQQNSHITLGSPQNLEYSQQISLPGTPASKSPQWIPSGQLQRYLSASRSPHTLQPQESVPRAPEDDTLTEEQFKQIMASQLQLQQQQQQQQLLHQQQMERIRLEQEALLEKLNRRLKA